MELNDIGQMIFNVWDEIPKYYDGIDIDEFQIMPNHIHGIVIIKNKTGKHGIKAGRHGDLPVHEPKRGLSLPDVMERFKSLTTKKYIDGVKLNNWKPFNKRLWQRNYYEHVIRDENDLKCTREYIINNPIKWEMDEYYK
ncbi:transposase [Candidatus Desantisbacteria bacterium]|nr:transposase [Candidatus Desantisbacteria bacterium]